MAEILHKDLTDADLHKPKAHKTSHQIGGSDVVNPDWSLINNKPISTVANIDDAVTKKHTQNTDTDLDATFEATLEHTANKGIVSGYASLDASALVPLAQIPATLTEKDADTVDTYHASSLEKIANKDAVNGYAGLDAKIGRAHV